MKVCYAKRHFGKLWVVKARKYKTPRKVYGGTHQTYTIGLWIGLDVFRHVSIGHPLGDDAEILGFLRPGYSQQRQDIWVRQALPDKDFPAELLGGR